MKCPSRLISSLSLEKSVSAMILLCIFFSSLDVWFWITVRYHNNLSIEIVKKKNIWKHWDLIVENFNKTLKFSIKIKWTFNRWQTLRVVSLNNYGNLNCSICYRMLTRVKWVKKNTGWIFFSRSYEFENVFMLFFCLFVWHVTDVTQSDQKLSFKFYIYS